MSRTHEAPPVDDILKATRPAEAVSARNRQHLRLTAWNDIVVPDDAANNWLVRGLLPSAGLAVIYGRPKSYKSFIALDLAIAIACDDRWAGRETRGGNVVYVAGEGADGMRKRVKAYKYEGIINAKFFLVATRLNLGTRLGGDLRELIGEIRNSLGEAGPVLIVMDTLSRMLGDGDENGDGMRAFVDNAETLAVELNCLVFAVHHQGIEANRPRGSTVLPGAAVSTWRIVKTSKQGARTCDILVEDAKDSESGIVLNVVLREVALDERTELERDDRDTTLIVQSITASAAAIDTMRERAERSSKFAPKRREFMKAVGDAMDAHGEEIEDSANGSKVYAVHVEAVRKLYYNKRGNEVASNSRRKAFQRHLEAAVEVGEIRRRLFGDRMMIWPVSRR